MVGPNKSRITFWYWAVVRRGSAGSEGAKGATLTAAPPLPLPPPAALLPPLSALPPLDPGCSALVLERPSMVAVQPRAPHALASRKMQIPRAWWGFLTANMRNLADLASKSSDPFRARQKS